jgi:hypothetical protein
LIDHTDRLLDYKFLDDLDLALLATVYRTSIEYYFVDQYNANAHLIKFYINSYTDLLLTNSTAFNELALTEGSMVLDYSNYRVTLYTSSTLNKTRLLQQDGTQPYKNKIDSANCEMILRLRNNITTLIVKIIEYKGDSFDGPITQKAIFSDSSLSISFYNPFTMEMLETGICNEDHSSSITYKFMLKPSPVMNLTLYKLIRNEFYEPFDLTNIFYNSRCVSILDPTYLGDTTVNYRRQNYFQNLQGICSSGCEYDGIDDDNYVTCICNDSGNDIFYYYDSVKPDYLPLVNLDVVTCPHITFYRVNKI